MQDCEVSDNLVVRMLEVRFIMIDCYPTCLLGQQWSRVSGENGHFGQKELTRQFAVWSSYPHIDVHKQSSPLASMRDKKLQVAGSFGTPNGDGITRDRNSLKKMACGTLQFSAYSSILVLGRYLPIISF